MSLAAWRPAALGAAIWAILTVFANPSGNVMSNAILGASTSLAERGRWELTLEWGREVLDVARVGERNYSGLPPGASLLAVPLYPLARAAEALWPVPQPFQDQQPELIHISPLLYWYQLACTLLLTMPAAAWIAVCAARVAAHMELPPAQQAWIGVLVVFGTSLFPHATTYSKELLAAAAVFFVFTRLMTDPPSPRAGAEQWLGLVAGLALAFDYKAVVPVVLVTLYAWIARGWRCAARMASGIAVTAFLVAVYHTQLFGAPWLTPYHFRIANEAFGHRLGYAGLVAPHATALWGLTFSPFQGAFLHMPYLLPVLAGAALSGARQFRREAAFSAAVVGMGLLFASSSPKMLAWSGGFLGWGPRQLTETMPYIAVLLAAALRAATSRLWRVVLWMLGGCSVAIQVLCACWGGSAFPGRIEVKQQIIANSAAILDVNPLQVMVRAVMQHGLTLPVARAYAASDAGAQTLTVLMLAGAVAAAVWILPLGRRQPAR